MRRAGGFERFASQWAAQPVETAEQACCDVMHLLGNTSSLRSSRVAVVVAVLRAFQEGGCPNDYLSDPEREWLRKERGL